MGDIGGGHFTVLVQLAAPLRNLCSEQSQTFYFALISEIKLERYQIEI